MLLYWFITILSDSVKWKLNIKKSLLTNKDMLSLIRTISENCKIETLLSQWKEWNVILKTIKQVNNINYELILASQLIKFEMVC